MANIKLRNVTKVYEPMSKKDRKFKAVDNFNLEINDGEFVIFVGPSGCGKSTTLRMIAGLEEITGGEIEINGVVVNKVHPKDRNIAMVFQNYALYAHMTVFENMAFGLKLKHVNKEEIRKKVNEAAAILNITDLLDRKPKQLSGGQRQRVALGRAIVRDPAVFLMDEPLSNLDAKLRVQMRTEIANLHKRLHATVIYVTHDQVEAMTMGTRIVVLKDGVIQQVDSPSELYKHPANMFVAGFIGSPAMNFFRGTVEDTHDGLSVMCSGIRIPIVGQKASTVQKAGYVGQEVVVGIRPEHLHSAAESSDVPNSYSFTTEIQTIENLGSENLIYFQLNGNLCCAKAGENFTQREGTVNLAIDLDRIHIFDAETQRTITN